MADDWNIPTATDASPENLDKVRDILFGGQMRHIETRLQSLEERFIRDLAQLRSDTVRQASELEQFARHELQQVNDRLTQERQRRGEEQRQLRDELGAMLRDLDQRHARLEQATGVADAELRDQVLQHARATAAEFQRLGERMAGELARAERELDARKADLAWLGTLFGEVSARLHQASPAERDPARG